MAKNKTRIDVITVFDGAGRYRCFCEPDCTEALAEIQRESGTIILRKRKIYAIIKTRFR